jgi:hypothetical protein
VQGTSNRTRRDGPRKEFRVLWRCGDNRQGDDEVCFFGVAVLVDSGDDCGLRIRMAKGDDGEFMVTGCYWGVRQIEVQKCFMVQSKSLGVEVMGCDFFVERMMRTLARLRNFDSTFKSSRSGFKWRESHA